MREQIIANFLAARGWEKADRSLLAQDASFRKFERLRDGERQAVLMDAPPPKEQVAPFITIAKHLNALGFNAPDLFEQDIENGLLLIEDFGDDTYSQLLANPFDNEHFLYALAIDVLTILHQIPTEQAIPAGLAPYDDDMLMEEACLLTDWYIPAITGGPCIPEAREAYLAAWRPLLERVQSQPITLVLRDYHVDNLMIIDGQEGIKTCGLLDFQDAVAGPTAYDLISLLEDARRDISDELYQSMMDRYLEAIPELVEPGPVGEEFKVACAILGAQRHTKVIGIFTRLYKRDSKPAYLHHIPRVWRLLERSIQHPALIDIRQWLDHHIPTQNRIIPISDGE